MELNRRWNLFMLSGMTTFFRSFTLAAASLPGVTTDLRVQTVIDHLPYTITARGFKVYPTDVSDGERESVSPSLDPAA